MSLKFRLLLDFRSRLETLSAEGIAEITQQLCQNQKQDKTSTMSKIFNKLYNDGDSNTLEFFNDLIAQCDQLQAKYPKHIKSQTNKNKNKITSIKFNRFNVLPDSVSCHIASFLNTKDLFTRWIHVNRTFCQIGLRPESIYCLFSIH